MSKCKLDYKGLQVILQNKMGHLVVYPIFRKIIRLIIYFTNIVKCLQINMNFNNYKLTISKVISQALEHFNQIT